MPAGKKRDLVTLQRGVQSSTDAHGAPVITWADIADVWAEVLPLSARQTVALQANQADITAQFVIRYFPGLDYTMRIMWNEHQYRIVELPPPAKPLGDLTIVGIAEAHSA